MATHGLASTLRRGPSRSCQRLFGDFPVRNVHVRCSNSFVGAAGPNPFAQ